MKIEANNLGAFTLIEMILAVGISAIVLICVNTVLFASLRLRDETSNLVDAASPVERTVRLLRLDLQNVVVPTNCSGGVLSGDFKVGDVSSMGIADPVAIEMFTTTGKLSPNAPWGEVQRVTYELRAPSDRSALGRNLMRSVVRNLLTDNSPDVEDQFMMSGVQNFTVSCYDGSGWQPNWDTTGLTSIYTNLPLAVRVDIQMAQPEGQNNNLGPIELVVPIDVQWPTNAVLNATNSTG
jgi:type II secretion system protein J